MERRKKAQNREKARAIEDNILARRTSIPISKDKPLTSLPKTPLMKGIHQLKGHT